MQGSSHMLHYGAASLSIGSPMGVFENGPVLTDAASSRAALARASACKRAFSAAAIVGGTGKGSTRQDSIGL